MAEESVNSAAMLVGAGEALGFAGVYEGETPDSFLERVEKTVEELDSGEGVVALVDIFGGTPNNTVYRLTQSHNIRIVTGFNLPMLIYAITERMEGMSMDMLVDGLMEAGTTQIKEFGKR